MIEQAVSSLTLMDMGIILAGFASLVGWFTRLEFRSQANTERLKETKETIKLLFEKIDKVSDADRRGPDRGKRK